MAYITCEICGNLAEFNVNVSEDEQFAICSSCWLKVARSIKRDLQKHFCDELHKVINGSAIMPSHDISISKGSGMYKGWFLIQRCYKCHIEEALPIKHCPYCGIELG